METSPLSPRQQRERALRQRAVLQEGTEAAQTLRDALARFGLALPSLRGSQPVDGRAFVDFGGASAELALQIAQALNAGADALQDRR